MDRQVNKMPEAHAEGTLQQAGKTQWTWKSPQSIRNEIDDIKYSLRRMAAMNLILLIFVMGIFSTMLYGNHRLSEQVRLQQWAIEYLEGKEDADALER